MSKKTNDQNVVPAAKVLTTSVSRIIAKFGFIFATVGLVIGILVMVFLNLGLHEKLMGGENTASEITSHNASNDVVAASEGDKTIGVRDLGVTFGDYAMMYSGEEYELVAQNTQVLPEGVNVTYVNNKHKDVGVYTAVAIFSGEGYVTEVLEAEFKIVKAEIKGITFDNALVEYKEGTTHEITVKGELPEGVEVSYSLNMAEEVGVYHATAVLYGKNYDNLVLEATLTIVDLTKLVFFPDVDEEAKAVLFTYDQGEHKVELNTENVLPEILETRNFKVEYDNNTYVDAGEYIVTATVSADGFTTFTVPVKMIINKGDMEDVHNLTVDSRTVEYDGFVKAVSHSELPEYITSSIKYYVVLDSEGNLSEEIDPSEVCDPKTYRVVLVFTDSTGNCEEKTIERDFVIDKRNIKPLFDFKDDSKTFILDTESESGLGVARRLVMIIDTEMLHPSILAQNLVITYTYGDTVIVATYVFGEETVTLTYTMDGEEISSEEFYRGQIRSEVPISFTEVGDYKVKAVVGGNYYDKDAEINATYTINYARLTGVSVKSNQIVIANGKLHTPKYTAKSGTTVEILYNGEVVEGFKYFGFYNISVRFTKGNYQTTVNNVRYIVMFNPLIALIGMLVGMLLGLLVGLLTSGFWIKREKSSRNHFRAPSAIVANARGGIICESYAKCDNSGCTGRLYLSSQSIEFYADDYKALKDNFLIDIDDVRNVDAIAPNKIQVYAKKEVYTFTVPDGTAGEWAHEIVKA